MSDPSWLQKRYPDMNILCQSPVRIKASQCSSREYVVTVNFSIYVSAHICASMLIINASLYYHSEQSTHVTEHSPGPSVCRSVGQSVCLSVCLSVRKVYCGNTADWIQMSFEVVIGVG